MRTFNEPQQTTLKDTTTRQGYIYYFGSSQCSTNRQGAHNSRFGGKGWPSSNMQITHANGVVRIWEMRPPSPLKSVVTHSCLYTLNATFKSKFNFSVYQFSALFKTSPKQDPQIRHRPKPNQFIRVTNQSTNETTTHEVISLAIRLSVYVSIAACS